MHSPRHLSLVRKLRRGFSLIEVVLAIGIISFCLVGLAGLLSVGLNLSRVSAASTGNTMLFEKVVNQLRVASLDASNAQKGQEKTDIFPLPSLSTVGDEKTFTVDTNNRFVTEGATTDNDASRVVNVKILDPSDLNPDDSTTPLSLAKGGKVAFVRVKIKSAIGYNKDTDKSISAPSVFCTEISLLAQ